MLRAQGEGDFADPAKVAGAAHHHGRLGVADEVFDLGALVGGVGKKGEPARSVARYRAMASTDFSTCTATRLPSGSRAMRAGWRCGRWRGPGRARCRTTGAVCGGGFDGGAVQVRREKRAQGALEEVLVAHKWRAVQRLKHRGSLARTR